MKAIVFAAGLGTRIQGISKGKPKALVEFRGKTLLELAIDFLSKNGIEEAIVNIHHQSEMMRKFISETKFPIPISISDETEMLLDTGGGLLKAKSFFRDEDDFLVYNVDVISNIDIQKMYKSHKASNAISTLAVRNRATSRYLLFNKENKMIGWENVNTNEQIIYSNENYLQLAFSGIHILSTKIFDLLEQEQQQKFSITKSYIRLSKDYFISGYVHDSDYWFDVGKPESYAEASDFLNNL